MNAGKRIRRGLLTAFLAIWIAASLTCSMSIAPHYTADPALAAQSGALRFLVYTIRSFSADVEISSCLALAAGVLLYNLPRLRTTAAERILAGCFGGLFAFMQLLGRSYAENQNWSAVFGTRFVLFRAAVIFAGRMLLAACLVLYAFRLLDRIAGTVPVAASMSPKRFFLAAGVVILCWLPYYCAFFPGLSNPDTGMQIAWALHYPTEWLQYSPIRGEGIYATNHHPYFTTLLFGLFAKLGLLLGDISWGVALYCLGQLVLTALVMTGSWFYLRHVGLPERFFRGGLIFTAIFPLYPLYAITMLKDSLFSLACLTFSILLFEVVRTRGDVLQKKTFCVLIFCSAMLVMLSKNQGVYFAAAAGVLCLLFCRRRIRAAAALLAPVLLFQVLWVHLLLPAWNVAPGGKQEVLGLLFQQTARYVSTYPEDVTEEESAAIRAVIDYDHLPQLYRPGLADPVKFTYRQEATEEERAAYYQAWFQMFLRHPDIYVQALLNNIYGGFYLHHETALSYTDFDNRETAPYPELCVSTSPRLQIVGTVARILLGAVQHIPGIGLLFCIGFYPWVILFLFLDVLRRRQFTEILAQLPAILSVAVLILAPVNGSYRYAMPMIYSIPFLLSLRFRPCVGGEVENSISTLLCQIFRFGLVGGLCFLIDYILLAMLVEVAGFSTLAASAVSFSVSVAANYLLSVRYVFKGQRETNRFRELTVFLAMSLAGLGINQLLMYLGTSGLGIHYLLVKLAVTAIVMVYNFVSRKLFLERKTA